MADYEAQLLHKSDGTDKLTVWYLDVPYRQPHLRYVIETARDATDVSRYRVASIVLALCPDMEGVDITEWYWDEDGPANSGYVNRDGEQVWS